MISCFFGESFFIISLNNKQCMNFYVDWNFYKSGDERD